MYGTILAKLWRMYFVFNDPFRRKKRLSYIIRLLSLHRYSILLLNSVHGRHWKHREHFRHMVNQGNLPSMSYM